MPRENSERMCINTLTVVMSVGWDRGWFLFSSLYTFEATFLTLCPHWDLFLGGVHRKCSVNGCGWRYLIWSQCRELWFWSRFISCWCNCAAVHLASRQKGCPSALAERRPPGVEDELTVSWDRSSLADGGRVLAAGSGNWLANSCYFLQPSRVWSRLAWWLSVADAGCRAPFELPCFKVELIPTAWLNGPVSALCTGHPAFHRDDRPATDALAAKAELLHCCF